MFSIAYSELDDFWWHPEDEEDWEELLGYLSMLLARPYCVIVHELIVPISLRRALCLR